MGALAALKARTVIENAAQVIATELVCAAQGLEFHRPLRSTPPLEAALARVRERVPRVDEDRSLASELAGLADALRTGALTLVG
jgi:histidine ammonia-lyase